VVLAAAAAVAADADIRELTDDEKRDGYDD
jgi:hypothetical protein